MPAVLPAAGPLARLNAMKLGVYLPTMMPFGLTGRRAIEWARLADEAGFHVIGYDVSDRVCKLLMRGESHIQDVPPSEVAALVKNGLFEATTNENRLSETDAISIAVPAEALA